MSPAPSDTAANTATLPLLKIHFTDGVDTIDGGINPQRICALLGSSYRLIDDAEQPDFLFYSNYGSEHLRYTDCVKIFIGYENTAPDFSICDYAVSCVHIAFGKRAFWYPIALWNNTVAPMPPLPDAEALQRDFCSFIYRQSGMGQGAALRLELAQKLMAAYKHIHCPGKVLHNTDAPELDGRDGTNWQESKMRYLSRFKFNIAFENSDTPGYITEKLMDAYKAGTVPIYWGGEGDIAPFPKESMIYAQDYPTLDALIHRIREVDENDALYLAMLRANPLHRASSLPTEAELKDFLLSIVARGNRPFDKDSYGVADTTRMMAVSRGRVHLWGHMVSVWLRAAWALLCLNQQALKHCAAWRFHLAATLRTAAQLRRIPYNILSRRIERH